MDARRHAAGADGVDPDAVLHVGTGTIVESWTDRPPARDPAVAAAGSIPLGLSRDSLQYWAVLFDVPVR
jgi:hypothetical protein